VALNLYLDDCSNSDLLAELLRQAGHRVARPTDDAVGLYGEDDQVHFGFAAAHGLTIITKNPADFKALHDLDQRHSGILGVSQDNVPWRDMSNADIVRAVRNLEEAVQQGGPPIQGEFHTLNDWRY
jgi:hypothetical protein